MSISRARFLLTLVLALAVATASVSVAAARADGGIPLIDFCAIASANYSSSISLSHPSFNAFSGGTAYAGSACGRFVVDVYVPPGTASSFWGGVADPLTTANCNTLTVYLTLYRRSFFATSFTRVDTGTFKGGMVNGACALTQVSGDPAGLWGTVPGYDGTLASGMFGGATYRVAVAATVGSFLGYQAPFPVASLATWEPTT
jgi:hypothetical protein